MPQRARSCIKDRAEQRIRDQRPTRSIRLDHIQDKHHLKLGRKLVNKRAAFRNTICRDSMNKFRIILSLNRKSVLNPRLPRSCLWSNLSSHHKNQMLKRKWRFTKRLRNWMSWTLIRLVWLLIMLGLVKSNHNLLLSRHLLKNLLMC